MSKQKGVTIYEKMRAKAGTVIPEDSAANSKHSNQKESGEPLGEV